MANEKEIKKSELTDEQANKVSGGGDFINEPWNNDSDVRGFACYWCGKHKEGKRYPYGKYDICEDCMTALKERGNI